MATSRASAREFTCRSDRSMPSTVMEPESGVSSPLMQRMSTLLPEPEGPMTTTFLLPLAMGACEAVGGNVLTDAFGIVALVAMTPLFTIQLMGLVDKLNSRASTKALRQAIHQELESLEEGVIYWEE